MYCGSGSLQGQSYRQLSPHSAIIIPSEVSPSFSSFFFRYILAHNFDALAQSQDAAGSSIQQRSSDKPAVDIKVND